MVQRLMFVLFLGLYCILLAYIGLSDQQASLYNNPDGGNGDGYNPLPLDYQAPVSVPILFSPNAHLALADQAASAGKLTEAKQHAFNALSNNPAGGQIALMLMGLYIQPDTYQIELPTEEDIRETETIETEIELAPDNETEDFTEESEDEVILEEPTLAENIQKKTSLLYSLSPSDKAIADQVALLAYSLRPTYTDTLSPLAEYWVAQDNMEQALPLWSNLLERHGDMQQELFPLFHKVIHDATHDELFKTYLVDPPLWWTAFFQYLLSHEQDSSKLDNYYQARVNSANPPDADERNLYINHLTQQGKWKNAYQVWRSSLDKYQSSLEGLLYDGGFEATQKQDSLKNGLFGWNASQDSKIKITQAITRGMKGKYALQITFRKGTNVQFQHISQTRQLQPGTYALMGRYRLDRFNADKGLRWRLRCTDANSNLLGESPLFNGQTDWELFEFNFTVPNDCPAQLLRLESDSTYTHHNTFSGTIWFDDLTLQPDAVKTINHETDTNLEDQ